MNANKMRNIGKASMKGIQFGYTFSGEKFDIRVNAINQKAKNDDRLFKDLGDNLSFQNNMRNFHSMPNTTIPNGQKAFAEFCYGNMPSCKDGDNEQCSKINRRVGSVYY